MNPSRRSQLRSSARRFSTIAAVAAVSCLVACAGPDEGAPVADEEPAVPEATAVEALVAQYTPFRLTTDVSQLSDSEKAMLPLLIEAAQAMEGVYWQQAYGDREALLASVEDPAMRRFIEINYGPWDRLDDNAPFLDGAGAKPAGANFYPTDATEEEIEAAAETNPELLSEYTIVRRDDEGQLVAVPYNEAYGPAFGLAAIKLREAAALAEDPGLERYLDLRAEALETNSYRDSDMAWMDMKNNGVDIIIGPIEHYEDKLFGTKTAASAYVLVKDRSWSDRLAKYATMLPGLQRGLPVPDAYKQEEPGSDSDLGAYDVVYYAGDSNAGSKTIAVNLPNDEQVQLEKGTRRLQLKNTMLAKYEKIVVPIAGLLIAEDQRSNVSFEAFFGNTMFHEVAHGLGIKNTITGQGTVREALGANAAALEEGKADVLGLYMVSELHDQGEIDSALEDHHVTFVASIFRSIRFGAASAHGVANLVRFNFFAEAGAFVRDDATGTYRVDHAKMGEAMKALSERILTLQGDGDPEAVAAFVDQYGQMTDQLQADLDRVGAAGIPVDITFEQGVDVLGLDS